MLLFFPLGLNRLNNKLGSPDFFNEGRRESFHPFQTSIQGLNLIIKLIGLEGSKLDIDHDLINVNPVVDISHRKLARRSFE